MATKKPEPVGPAVVPSEEVKLALCRAGELGWLLDPHQAEVDEHFEEWNERRQTHEYTEECIASGATLDDVWVEEFGRRFGKTSRWIIKLASLGIKRPNAVLMYGTAYQKDIGEIVVPLARQLLEQLPDEVRPQYRTAHKEANEGLYFPNGSVIRLVGLDEHPDAARGRFSDGIVLSEAGFMKGLEDLVRAVLLPQFQRRPWAFLALESSTPKQPDHDFSRVFRPDARMRRAYLKRTIDDNVVITQREKDKAIRMAGGRGHPTCDREYFCEETRDPNDMVIPEFVKAKHVQERARPDYAMAMASADPGMKDLFGAVWAYWDWKAAKLVVEHSWAERNAATSRVAAVFAAVEHILYGASPSKKMAKIPLYGDADTQGWADLLKRTPYVFLAPKLWELAQDDKRQIPQDHWKVGYPKGRFVWWSGSSFRENPARRVTDVDTRLIADCQLEHGLAFDPTLKDDKDAQINLVRDWHALGRITYLPTAGPVVEHVNNAIWNEKRTDWAKSAEYGHFDCLSALIYLVRNAGEMQHRRPFPPQYTDLSQSNLVQLPWAGAMTVPNGGEASCLHDVLDDRRAWR